MNRKLLVAQMPVSTVSGYGAHCRDLMKSIFKIFNEDEFEILVVPTMWGSTPMNALDPSNPNDLKIIDHFIKTDKLDRQPDLFIQATIPSEFLRIGKYNLGVTAATETSMASIEFLNGVNTMDLTIVPSEFTKKVLTTTQWTKKNNQTGQIEEQIAVRKPVEVLFEGIDTDVYYKTNKIHSTISSALDSVNENFLFLTVGHWLKGDFGQDRKDISSVIKVFYETFKDRDIQPALLLKLGTSGEIDKANTIKRIKEIRSLVAAKKYPEIYLLNGNLTDDEMNGLYNHPKVKAMVSFTHGEGFGRPLLEFSVTGKPILATDWSGHLDFLPATNAILLKGKLEQIHPSAAWDHILIKESSWFRVDYTYAAVKMDLVFNHPGQFIEMGRKQINNAKKFSLDKMTEKFEEIIKKYYIPNMNESELIIPKLPKLKKLEKTMDQLIDTDQEQLPDFDISKLEGFKDIQKV